MSGRARDFAAQAIDSKPLIVSDLARVPATPPYSGTATAILIDGEIWLSSYNGDRVAYGRSLVSSTGSTCCLDFSGGVTRGAFCGVRRL